MIVKTEAIAKIVYNDGGYQWIRIGRGKNLKHTLNNYLKIASFRYAKVYQYNRVSKVTGFQIAYFGINKRTGEVYLKQT